MNEPGHRVGFAGLSEADRGTFWRILRPLVGLYVAGWFLLLVAPNWVAHLALTPGRLSEPYFWYTLLSYAVVHGSLHHLLVMLILSGLSLLILAQRRSPTDLVVLMVTSVVLGGLFFLVLSTAGHSIIGSNFITASLGGAVIVEVMASPGRFRRAAWGFAAIMGLFLILGAMIGGTVGFVAVVVAVGAGVFVWLNRPGSGGATEVALQE